MEQDTNPLVKFLGAWIDTPYMRELFIACPKAAIQTHVGVPEEINMSIIEHGNHHVKFKASIPIKPLSDYDRQGRRILDRRLKKCPVINISGEEMINNPILKLKELGIRVPEDIEIVIDEDPNGYIHYICDINL